MLRSSWVLVIFAVAADKISAFPSDIERCKLSDEKCLLKAANKMLKRHSSGNEDLGLPSIDPMHMDYVKLRQDAGVVTVRGTANDSYASGLSKGKIERFGGFDAGLMQIKFKTPRLNVSGIVKTVAHVISLPINNNGKYRVAFNDFDVTLKSTLTRFTRDGKEYFKLSNTKMSFTTSGGDLNVSDLGYLINLFLNASFDVIKSSLSGVIGEAWSEHFEKIFNAVLSRNSIDELFLI